MLDHQSMIRSSYLSVFEVKEPASSGRKSVLVVRIGRLGDTILATPVIDVLQQHFGDPLTIDFASSGAASEYILSIDDRIDRVFPIMHRRLPWRLNASKKRLEKHSRKNPYDLVINLECGSECDDFIQFVHFRKFCGRPQVSPEHRLDRHCVDTEKSIYAKLLGEAITDASETALQTNVGRQALPIEDGRGCVLFNPGFSGIGRKGYQTHRGWPESNWIELAALIRQRLGLAVLVNGTENERRYFARLLEQEGVYSLFGSDLSTLIDALGRSSCLVSVDTGTMHLAAALGVQVVALFGPGNPSLTGPYSKTGKHRVLSAGLDCQPCARTSMEKLCQFNRCMSVLDSARVYAEINTLLSRP